MLPRLNFLSGKENAKISAMCAMCQLKSAGARPLAPFQQPAAKRPLRETSRAAGV